MPFKSKAQQRWMFANKPRMAERWADHTPDIKALPEKKKTAGMLSPGKGQPKIDETMRILGKQGINVGLNPADTSREYLKFSGLKKALGFEEPRLYDLLCTKKQGATVMKKTAEQIADYVLAKVAQGPAHAPGVGGGAGGGRAAQVAAMKQKMQAHRQQQQQQGMQAGLGAAKGIRPTTTPSFIGK